MLRGKHSKTGILILVLCFVMVSCFTGVYAAQSAAPTDYYVSTTGSDSNDGSHGKPFLTIQKAADVAMAGSTVHVAPGTYADPVICNNSGTASARIRFVSDEKWKAVMHVCSSDMEAVVKVNGDYVNIEGFEIIGDAIGQPSSRTGIIVYSSYIKITGNKVHGFAKDVTAPGVGSGEGILTWGGHDIDITGNIVYNIGNKKVNDNQSHGIYCNSQRGYVSNNICYDASGGGIHCWHAANNLTFSNNLVFNNGTSGIIVGNGDSGGETSIADYFTVTNNICIDNGYYGIQEYTNPGTNQTGIHNVYSNNLVLGNKMGGIQLLNDLVDTNTLTSDPQFVDYKADGSGGYSLSPTSPCIDAGTSNGAPAFDFNGTARPSGAVVDIGPYEFTPGWYSKADFSALYNLSSSYNDKETVEFDVTPLLDSVSTVIGYADSSVTIGDYSSMAMLIALEGNGVFDARNGPNYESIATVNYKANTKYHIKMVVNFRTKQYDLYVTPPGGKETKIAENYDFRSDAPDTNNLGKVCLLSGADNQVKVENHSVVHRKTLPPIIPAIAADKEKYTKDEIVSFTLKLEKTAGKLTNSASFEVEYDAGSFTLLGNDPKTAVVDGYIPFNSKSDLGSGAVKKVKIAYLNTDKTVALKEGEKVFTINFKVKGNAPTGTKTFKVAPATMIATDGAVYNVNNGKALVKTVQVENYATVNGYINIYLGDAGTSLNKTILKNLDQATVNNTFKNLRFTLKNNFDNTELVLKGSDVFSKDKNENYAVKGSDGRVTGKFSISSKDTSFTILKIDGAGYVPVTVDISLNDAQVCNVGTITAPTTLYPGDLGQITDDKLVTGSDGKITNADFSEWIRIYQESLKGTVSVGDKLKADFTKDGVINDQDFNLWLEAFKKVPGSGK